MKVSRRQGENRSEFKTRKNEWLQNKLIMYEIICLWHSNYPWALKKMTYNHNNKYKNPSPPHNRNTASFLKHQ